MVLAGDVHNRDGRLLFSKGRCLADKDLKILKMWGITEAAVSLAPAEENAVHLPVDDSVLKKISDHLSARFNRNDLSHPATATVLTLCTRRLADRYQKDPDTTEKMLRSFPAKETGPPVPETITPVKNLERLFRENIELPALPTIFNEINEAVNNPSCSGKDIADIVSKDTSLSAKLLKIINSAYYGIKQKVESLSYAAVALGTSQISSLALGITVVNYFKGIPNQCISMKMFWEHSISCAIAAKTLSAYVRDANLERVFIGGLLHDIGRLILLKYYPEQSAWLMAVSRKKSRSMVEAEPMVFSLSHAELGGLIVRSWNFSDQIAGLIQNHHGPFTGENVKEVALIHFSDWLVHALEIGSSGEQYVPKLDPAAWDTLGISKNVLEQTIQQIDRQVSETIRFFYE